MMITMSKCRRCNSVTNSQVSRWDKENNTANGCFGAFDVDTQTWRKGCCYPQADRVKRFYVDRLLRTQPAQKKDQKVEELPYDPATT
jgi:hypothetical protein